MARRVVVTGMGAVTSVGNDLSTTWENLVAGKSGVDYITRYDTVGFKTTVAAEVKDFHPEDTIESKQLKHMDRNVQYGLVAALEALADSGVRITEDTRDRVGVIFGSGGGGQELIRTWSEVLIEKGPRRISPFFMPNMIADAASSHIAITTGAAGPNYCTTSACASGANAVTDGMLYIKANKADAMIVGGTEAVLMPIFHACFEAMRVMSPNGEPPATTSKPFDLHRTGFVSGEGAAALILEDMDHALARGATIYAELAGAGSANDSFDMAAPDPSGRGLLNAMRQAMDEACLLPADIGYINAHGTATKAGDRVEVFSIKEILGESAKSVLISSIKPATGHMMGASGALEVVIATLSLHHGVIPPTLNYETLDPDCDLDCVPNDARKVDLRASMSISAGLGGHNAAVLLKRWENRA